MEYYPMFDFTGGWVDARPPVLLAPNELERADNVRILPGGGWEMRAGCDDVGNDDGNTSVVSGLAIYTTAAGTLHLVRTKNSKVEYLSAGTWTDITGAYSLNTTEAFPHVFAVFRGNLVGTNATSVPWKWPGSGNIAAIARAIGGGADTIDRAAAMCTHRERLVLGDVTATETAVQTRYESVIWPSDAGTLDTWSASPTGKIHLGQGDGDSITCLLSHLGKLVVFKHNSLWSVSDHGSSTQVATKIASVGTPSRRGAVIVEDLIYFISSTGLLYSYNPRAGDTPDALTELTRPKLAKPNNVLAATAASSFLAFHQASGEVLVWVTDTRVSSPSGTNNAVWVYNRDVNCWSRWYFDKRHCSAIYGPSAASGGESELLLGTSDGFVREEEQSTGLDKAGQSVAVTVYYAPIHCGAPGTVKQWDWIQAFINDHGNTTSSGMDVTLYQDTALPATSTGQSYTLTFTSATGVSADMYDRVTEQRLTGYSKWTRFRTTYPGVSINERFRFAGMLIGYTPTGPRR